MNALVEAARGGSIRAASRLISLIEDDPSRACALWAELGGCAAPRLTVGVTGAPGAGKSRLIGALLKAFRRREPDKRLGVLAVDPSSPRSGGAVLGDRIRMMDHAGDERIFIRSLSNRGRLGGLTLGIRQSLAVMGLVGCDVVFVETVGVGQNEIEIAQVADLVVVALAPGFGDTVQLLKSGLLEIADVVVVNKADRAGAERLFAELNATLALAAGLPPATFLASALDERGIDELAAGIERVAQEKLAAHPGRRMHSPGQEIASAVREAAVRALDRALAAGALSGAAVERVLGGQISLERAAAELLAAAAKSLSSETSPPVATAPRAKPPATNCTAEQARTAELARTAEPLRTAEQALCLAYHGGRA